MTDGQPMDLHSLQRRGLHGGVWDSVCKDADESAWFISEPVSEQCIDCDL